MCRSGFVGSGRPGGCTGEPPRLLATAACLAATNCQYAAAAGCRFRLQVQVQVAFQGGLLGSHKLPICSGCRLQVQVAGAGAGCFPRRLAWQPQTVNMQRLQVAGSGCRCRCRLLSKAACLAATNCQYAAAAGCRFRLQVQVQVAFQGGLLGSHKLSICSGCRLQVQVAGASAGAGCFPRRLA
jgi:hypothetical protein